jgi:hypothetical protein
MSNSFSLPDEELVRAIAGIMNVSVDQEHRVASVPTQSHPQVFIIDCRPMSSAVVFYVVCHDLSIHLSIDIYIYIFI